jgi:protoheme IX farnesyltransferase
MKAYYQLAKPGIIYGNSISALAGFFLASGGTVNWLLCISTIVGLALVMGGSCVFNNYLDADIDAQMERTKIRATVTHQISKKNTLIYGSILLGLGMLILYVYTNILALSVALVGTIVYVLIYTPFKRKTVHATLIGSIAGATPPVVGFCAVTHTFNLEAFLLFLILVIWQMPHFYAISLFRSDEYKAASIPVLPLVSGIRTTKIHMLLYIIAFLIASTSLTFFHFTGYIYFIIMLVLSLIWIYKSIQGFKIKTEDASANASWAKKMFLFSLIVLTVWSIVLALNVVLV